MRVKLLDCSENPIFAISQSVGIMMGKEVDGSEEIEKVVLDLRNTGLQGALENAFFVFKVEGVTRAFTHQLVRYRHMSFSQESLRFVAKRGQDFQAFTGPSIAGNRGAWEIWKRGLEDVRECYEELLEMGVDTQDARGILPTNILTNIIVGTNFRALVNMAETRLCYQAQKGEWGEFIRQVKDQIEEEVFRGEVLVKFLEPICDRTGRCEFKSLFDRECPVAKERGW